LKQLKEYIPRLRRSVPQWVRYLNLGSRFSEFGYQMLVTVRAEVLKNLSRRSAM